MGLLTIDYAIGDLWHCTNKDTKKVYSLINNLTSSKAENPMPDVESDEALANTFADYFMEKIEK